jgi:heptosyltransferase-2
VTTPAPIPQPRHLVVRLPNPAGDVVAATPALRALRAALAGTRITWCGRPPALALLDGLRDRDEVLSIEGSLDRGWTAPRRLGRTWGAAGADAVLLLTNSWSSAWAAAASRVPVSVGYVLRPRPKWMSGHENPWSRQAMLTHALFPVRHGGRTRPEAMRTWYLRLAALLGASDDGHPARLALTPEGESLARRRLAAPGFVHGYFAVSPGASYGPSKVYPVARVVEVVRRVRERTNLPPVILGGPGEEAIVAEVAARVGAPCLASDAVPARWPETKALLAGASLLLTTDAGPRHVAAALGTPVVVWMGPTDPRWSAGDEATTTVVRREDLSCLGCHLKACPIGHVCMAGLDPEIVAAAALARARR